MKKICTKCEEEKSVAEFCKNKNTKGGLCSWCKECINQYYEENKEKIKQYREENKERMKEYHKQWREKNKEKIKQYNEENKEKKKKYNKQRYEANKEKIKEYSKQYRKEKAKYDTYAEQISFCEKVRRDPKDDILLQVICTESGCRKWFNPTNREVQHRIESLNEQVGGESRFYCSEECKQTCSLYDQNKYPKGFKPDHSRPDQPDWAKLVKERDNYECQRCGSKDRLEAHHIEGIYENPFMSCDVDLGITFCTECHKESHKDVGCRYSDLTRRSLCKGK